jgi:hypothetical protein
LFKIGSNFVQKTPPFFNFVISGRDCLAAFRAARTEFRSSYFKNTPSIFTLGYLTNFIGKTMGKCWYFAIENFQGR